MARSQFRRRGSSAHVFGLIGERVNEIADTLAAALDTIHREAERLIAHVDAVRLNGPGALLSASKPVQDAFTALVPLAARRDAILAAVAAVCGLANAEDAEGIARRFDGPGLEVLEDREQFFLEPNGTHRREARYAGIRVDLAGHPVARLIAATGSPTAT